MQLRDVYNVKFIEFLELFFFYTFICGHILNLLLPIR